MFICDPIRIDRYSFYSNDRLFIDANVLLLVYGPQDRPNDPLVFSYSDAMRKAIWKKAEFFTHILTITEYVSNHCRIEFKRRFPEVSKEFTRKYKEYRKTDDFSKVIKDIALSLKNILAICKIEEGATSDSVIREAVTVMGKGQIDFCDQIIAELCFRKGYTLVTHDLDFRCCPVRVLSANRKYFL